VKLSDVMSHAGLAGYAEVALILFFLVFVSVMVRLWRPKHRAELEAQRMLPLEPDTPAQEREGAAR
jgi:cbb3-type cytochrome oxidase subunit 3